MASATVPTTYTPNLAKLRETYEWLVANPDHHDQGLFVCGTTMCIAGCRVVQDANMVADVTSGRDVKSRDVGVALNVDSYGDFGEVNWHGLAQQSFGLDSETADILFYTMNDDVALEMLRMLAFGEVDHLTENTRVATWAAVVRDRP